ncbi:hypothetical protein SAMN05444157_3221 [Frankineae bacterium MT45]|nr:hypothetical protein SAMN05444157_3221 [Frankineae bacterium MT45]
MTDAPLQPTPEDADPADGRSDAVPSAPPRPRTATNDKPVLPTITRDESDDGWGERSGGGFSDDWYERERPPHHG